MWTVKFSVWPNFGPKFEKTFIILKFKSDNNMDIKLIKLIKSVFFKQWKNKNNKE